MIAVLLSNNFDAVAIQLIQNLNSPYIGSILLIVLPILFFLVHMFLIRPKLPLIRQNMSGMLVIAKHLGIKKQGSKSEYILGCQLLLLFPWKKICWSS